MMISSLQELLRQHFQWQSFATISDWQKHIRFDQPGFTCYLSDNKNFLKNMTTGDVIWVSAYCIENDAGYLFLSTSENWNMWCDGKATY